MPTLPLPCSSTSAVSLYYRGWPAAVRVRCRWPLLFPLPSFLNSLLSATSSVRRSEKPKRTKGFISLQSQEEHGVYNIPASSAYCKHLLFPLKLRQKGWGRLEYRTECIMVQENRESKKPWLQSKVRRADDSAGHLLKGWRQRNCGRGGKGMELRENEDLSSIRAW